MASVELARRSHKAYGACRDHPTMVSLAIEDRAFVALVGPSGCGKSTTLQHDRRARDCRPRADIAIGGTDVTWLTAGRARCRDGVPVLRALSRICRVVREHNAFRRFRRAGAAASAASDVVRRKVRRVAEPSWACPPCSTGGRAQISGGQRQRVALARAMVRTPHRLSARRAAVEPRPQQLRVADRSELKDLHLPPRRQRWIYVTHDQGEALTLSDNDRGSVTAAASSSSATPRALYERPAQSVRRAKFLGRARDERVRAA